MHGSWRRVKIETDAELGHRPPDGAISIGLSSCWHSPEQDDGSDQEFALRRTRVQSSQSASRMRNRSSCSQSRRCQCLDLADDFTINVRRQNTCLTYQLLPNLVELGVGDADPAYAPSAGAAQ